MPLSLSFSLLEACACTGSLVVCLFVRDELRSASDRWNSSLTDGYTCIHAWTIQA